MSGSGDRLTVVVRPSTSFRPASGTIPEAPGVYRFRDATGRGLYVGKSKSLRQRLNSYFADPWSLHARWVSEALALRG